ncbi:MAG: hypothetical protein VR65_05105 [Desulfobulbaceae bacterium BRH_c16a]|nr:MAG: hypothetical protein VR65_05105 [Desulfobulbaceae bacterium BRH_c16a]
MFDSVTIKPTVLIIEADAAERNLLQNNLEKRGCHVLAAENGPAGLEIWAEKMRAIRIVITGLGMPLANGFEVIKTIRAQEEFHTCIILLATGRDDEALHKGLDLGADDFVGKPVVPEVLFLRLQGALRMLRLQDQYTLVLGLAELAAERGGESAAHLQRTRKYCHLLADDLRLHHPSWGLTKQLVDDIANLSVLHDIGKNGLPDGLLNKRGKYTPKEYEIIKDHTVLGGNILNKLYQRTGSIFFLLGYEIAMAHHEKWDGSGYPLRLKGEKIPLAGRIMAFADVYDVLLSRRPYKDPLSINHAEFYIRGEKGRHFDPAVVESYERNRERFAEIQKSIQEMDFV